MYNLPKQQFSRRGRRYRVRAAVLLELQIRRAAGRVELREPPCSKPGPTFQPGLAAKPSVFIRTDIERAHASALPSKLEPGGGQKSNCTGPLNAESVLPPTMKRARHPQRRPTARSGSNWS
jgi:hypothetical protein